MLLCVLMLLMLVHAASWSDEYVIEGRSEWTRWVRPEGVVDLRADGSLALKDFAGQMDPMLNMGDFEHVSRTSGTVRGGIKVRSNTGTARRLVDRDTTTWWQPRASDGLDNWWVEVDLGRLVLLQKIRLVFPDTVGARPFRDFGVYVSEGMPIWDGQDDRSYRRVATTILPNRERVLEYDLFTQDPSSGPNEAKGENLVTADSLNFTPAQYIRFVPRSLTEDAALAEIEAVSVGENIALGTIGRFGGMRSSERFGRTTVNVFDGSVEKFWMANAAKAAEREWKVGGQYFEWDLGVSFWLNQIVFYTWPPTDLGQTNFQSGTGPFGHEFEVSDGTPINIGGGEDRFRGPYDYERISLVDNQTVPRRWIFQHQFDRTKTRYIFHHHYNWGRTGGWGYKVWEIFLYAPGYPAEVELVSAMIDLKSVLSLTNVSWDAELPPGTSVSIRTKTGDELGTKLLYYDVKGNEVTEARWTKLKSFQRGDTRPIEFEGDDWSAWSEPYKVSGEAFKSPSPRGFVRFRVILSTDDPEVTPVLKTLRLSHQTALFRQAVEGQVFPREGKVGEWADLTLRIYRPQSVAGAKGYNGLVIPLSTEARDISVAIGGEESDGSTAEFSDDSLRISLSERVMRDSVDVRFSARLLENPTFINPLLVNSGESGVRQAVKPADEVGPDALTVFLPDLAAGGKIISNVSVGGGTVTPNGDGANDDLVVTFDLLKAEVVPEVAFYDVAGRMVRTLQGQAGTTQRLLWNGRGEGDARLPPGIYVCRIEVKTHVGTRTATEVVHVAY